MGSCHILLSSSSRDATYNKLKLYCGKNMITISTVNTKSAEPQRPQCRYEVIQIALMA